MPTISIKLSEDIIHYGIVNYTIPYNGFFPEVLIFPNFHNELVAREILILLFADCFIRVDCVIVLNIYSYVPIHRVEKVTF